MKLNTALKLLIRSVLTGNDPVKTCQRLDRLATFLDWLETGNDGQLEQLRRQLSADRLQRLQEDEADLPFDTALTLYLIHQVQADRLMQPHEPAARREAA